MEFNLLLDFPPRGVYSGRMKKTSEPPFSPSLHAVAAQIGDLVTHSGFDPLAGQAWTVLFTSPHPLDARAVGRALKTPPKKVAAALAEMETWGAVSQRGGTAAAPLYGPEINPIKILKRVLREREVPGMDELSARLRAAREDHTLPSFARERVHNIEEILRVGRIILDIVLMVAQLDTSALKRARDAIAALSTGIGGVLGRLTRFRD